MEGRGLLL